MTAWGFFSMDFSLSKSKNKRTYFLFRKIAIKRKYVLFPVEVHSMGIPNIIYAKRDGYGLRFTI